MIPWDNSHEWAGSPLYSIKNDEIFKKKSLKMLTGSGFILPTQILKSHVV